MYRVTSDDITRPDEFYSRDTACLPFSQNLYVIYDRLNSQYIQTASPVGLDTFWHAVAGSRYLKGLGCQTLDAEADRMVCLDVSEN